MKSMVFVMALAAAAGTAFAQNSIVNTEPGTFVDISGLGASTLVNNVRVDDTSFPITSSVTNSVFVSTNVRICSNGFIQFGAATGATAWTNATIAAGTTSPVAPTTAQALFPFWDDHLIPVDSGGEIYWMEGAAATFGLPASRGNVLIIQWNNVPHYDLGNPVGAITYQVQIFQNVVDNVAAQIIYSDISFDDVRFDNGVTATIGYAAGTTGGPGSSSNFLYAFNTAGSVNNGDVLSVLANTAPSNPAITATSATPATVAINGTTLFTATVVAGGNPTSTALMVMGDLSGIGGSGTQQFFDNGTNGDVTAGDNIFSFSTSVMAGAGAYSIPLTVSDAQGRNGAGAVNVTVSAPTAMTLTGGVLPSTTSATSVLVTARPTAGNFPASTGITVTANLTSLGGSATAAMFDDGTNGDVAAGDGTYSVSANLPADGTHQVTLTAEDDQERTVERIVALMYKNAGLIQGTDNDLATEDVITATMPTFLGSVGWMRFELGADVADDADAGTVTTYLEIDTEGTGIDNSVAGSLSDTEIGVYRTDGTMVANDDDDGTNFHSRLSFGDVAPVRPALVINASTGTTGNGRDGMLATGVYYLAIGNFNMTFGAANFNATTANTTAADGEFLVNFRTNLPGSAGACSEADIGIAGGLPGQDHILDNNDFIAFINYFFAMNPVADMGVAGGLPGSDSQWDNNDFIAFIGHFFDDVAACNG